MHHSRRQCAYAQVTLTPDTLSPWHLVALLGAAQGAMLAVVLAARKTNRTANRLLAAAVAFFAVNLAIAAYPPASLLNRYPHLFGVGHPMPFLYGPLIYLYALSASDRSRRLTKRDVPHFLPFILVIVTGLPIYLMPGAEKVALYQGMERGDVPWQVSIAVPLKLISGLAYSAATLRFLRKHRAIVAANYSSLERVNLNWLVWLALSAAVIWAVATALTLVEPMGVMPPALDDAAIPVMMTLLVYGIGFMGLRQPEIFRFDTSEHRVPVEARQGAVQLLARAPAEPARADPIGPEAEETEPAATVGPHGSSVADPERSDPVAAKPAELESIVDIAAPASRYERSGLTERQAAALRKRLLETMERDQPYRDSELTLADLAAKLGTSPHKLSETLNTQVGLSFYDFVNGYRVRDVQQRLQTEDASRLTFLTLALDAGFASKSTFNAVFKKHTGQTPSDYRVAAERSSARRSA